MTPGRHCGVRRMKPWRNASQRQDLHYQLRAQLEQRRWRKRNLRTWYVFVLCHFKTNAPDNFKFLWFCSASCNACGWKKGWLRMGPSILRLLWRPMSRPNSRRRSFRVSRPASRRKVYSCGFNVSQSKGHFIDFLFPGLTVTYTASKDDNCEGLKEHAGCAKEAMKVSWPCFKTIQWKLKGGRKGWSRFWFLKVCKGDSSGSDSASNE